MPKFFVNYSVPNNTDKIKVTGEDRRHMKDVLRINPGEKIVIGDDSGNSFECELTGFDTDTALLKIIRRNYENCDSPVKIVVFQGLPKSDKLENIIQKCTELGAAVIVPVICARSIAKLKDENDINKKLGRWQKIATEASKQSGRSRIPEVHEPVKFAKAIELAQVNDFTFIPWECEENTSIKSLIKSKQDENPSMNSIAFFIGPEGGFDADEINLALSRGITPVTLGKRILRTETAAPAVLAMLMYEFELI